MKPSMGGFKPGGILPVIAILLALAGVWQLWSGWKLHATNALNEATDDARRRVAAEIKPVLEKLLDHAESLRQRVALSTALQRQDINAAKDVVAQGWSGIEATEFIPPDLTVPYSDPEAFGYGKLGVIERALQDDRAHAAVVKDGGKKVLADIRRLRGRLSAGETYLLVHKLPLGSVPADLRTAILESAEQRAFADFLETVLVNVGARVKCTVDRDQALAWLRASCRRSAPARACPRIP